MKIILTREREREKETFDYSKIRRTKMFSRRRF